MMLQGCMGGLSKLVRAFFKPQITTFLIGIVTTLTLQALSDNTSLVTQGLLNLLVGLLIIHALGVMARLDKAANKRVTSSGLVAGTIHSNLGEGGDEELYEFLTRFTLSAQRSIRVVHRNISLWESTPPRERYFKKIENHLYRMHQNRKTFTYERVLQVVDSDLASLPLNCVDELMLKHCQNVLTLEASGSSVASCVGQISNYFGYVGFTIVDDCKICFLFPSVARNGSESLEVARVGTALYFDNVAHTHLITAMRNLFRTLLVHSTVLTSAELDRRIDDAQQIASGS